MTGLPTCSICGNPVQRNRPKFFVRPKFVVCGKCWFRGGTTRPLHARFFPGCPDQRHDMYDHTDDHIRCDLDTLNDLIANPHAFALYKPPSIR